jgi:hypothetical protein
MNCRDVRDLLVAYLDDELSEAERARVQHHLSECADCQREFGGMWQIESRVRRSLRAMAAGAEVPAGAWPDLQTRIAAQTGQTAQLKQTVGSHLSTSENRGGIMRNLSIRRPFAAAALAALILVVSVVMLVAPVRAQVIDAVTRLLRIPMAGSHSGITVPEDIVPFRPLAPTYLPEGYRNSYMVSGGAPGAEILELRAFSPERFVIVFERQTGGDEALPAGQDVQVGEHSAVLETGLQGTANILIPAPQPDHMPYFAAPGGGGGGGGGGRDPRESLPDSLAYDDGVRITWLVGDVWVEILSNEPVDEVLRVAESMQPVEVVEEVEESLPLSGE